MKIKHFILFLFFALLFSHKVAVSQTISPMTITCVKVEANGDVSLNFEPAVVTGNATFNGYEIHYSNNINGPFTPYLDANSSLLGVTSTSVPIPLTLPNANSQPYYFFTVIKYTAVTTTGFTDTSDVVSSIFVQYSSVNDGYSNLSWNPVRTPLLISSSSYYKVNRGFTEFNFPPSAPNSVSDSSSNISVIDNLTGKCDDNVIYQISIKDNSGCISKSNTITETFTTPGAEPPIISYATYSDDYKKSRVVYSPSVSTFATGYIAYKLSCTGPAIADTIPGYNTTVYNDYDTIIACNDCKDFRVASFFVCQSFTAPNPIPFLKIGQPSIFNNIMKVTESFNKCTYAAKISWCPYKNWSYGLGGYKLWVSKVGELTNNLVATLDSNTTTYTYIVDKDSADYVFQVEAFSVNGNFSSLSFPDTMVADVYRLPKEVFLRYVTVLPDDKVQGCFTNDTLTDIHHYEIFRADTAEGPFEEKVDEVKFDIHKNNLFFVDTTALVNEQNYYYKILAIDSCKNLANTSNTAKTILLKTNPELNFTSEMSWNNYEGWPSGVNYYKIYRSYSTKFEETLIEKQLLDSGLTYIDDISDSINDDGNYCYRVLAVSVFDTLHYEIDTSHSNFVCIRQTPHIFVPSAFTPPDGYNPIFKPIMAFVPNGSYELRIFDRWGLLMADIKDVDMGWDGKYKGVDAPIGIYSWQIRYKNLKNEFKYTRGTVALVR